MHLGVFVLYISIGSLLVSHTWPVPGDGLKCPSDELIPCELFKVNGLVVN